MGRCKHMIAWLRVRALHVRVRLVLARKRWRDRRRAHVLRGVSDRCRRCGKPRARVHERCLGVDAWYPRRAETTLCGTTYAHRAAVIAGPYIAGCEICDGAP
jgi:hypothetical protein